MLRIFINSFIRQFRRNLSFSLLNILGLSLGISISYMIVLYVSDELSFDRLHSNGDRMYRVGLKARLSNDSFKAIHTCAPMAEALPLEVPGIERATRIAKWDEVAVQIDDDKYLENSVLLADGNFFQFFDFKLISGNPNTVLAAPYQIVLSEDWAQKFFGHSPYDEILGQFILIGNDRKPYLISGIAANSPKKSHIQYSFLISMESWEMSQTKNWTNNILMTYFVARPGIDAQSIEADMVNLVEKYIGPEVQKMMGISIQDFYKSGGEYGYFTQPLFDIHLHSKYENDLSINGDYQNVVIFSIVALFVLIIAGVNFINLSTAKAIDRAGETGVRKALGASRSHLIGQFLVESIIYVLVSSLIAIVILILGLDFMNNLMNKEFSHIDILSPFFLLVYFLIAIVIGLSAGIYPSLVLSSYKTVDTLKGKTPVRRHRKINPRNLLVGFQFTLTAVALILTIVVQGQLRLMQTADLGFEPEQILVIKNAEALGEGKRSMKNEMEALPFVRSVSLTNAYPPVINYSSVFRISDTQEDHGFMYYQTDQDHLDVFGYELLEGRFFEEGMNDELSVVINESAMKRAGWESIEGKSLQHLGDTETNYKVIGVVKDFHIQDFRTDVSRLVMFYAPEGNFITMKIQNDQMSEAIDQIEMIWDDFSGGEPFNYAFVDQQFSALWEREDKLADLSLLFSVLTIVTAGLGLFGLASYIARNRRHEFGIRKILGAGGKSIIGIQARYFLKITFASFVISIPTGYYLVETWLNDFVYRIPNDFSIYFKAMVLILIIIVSSVGYQLLKSANMTPLDVLREE